MSLALLVCVSLIGLALGPLLASIARSDATAAAIDALALGLVPTVLLIRILPHLWSSIGALAAIAGAIGYVAMWLADRRGHHGSDRLAPAVVYPALVIHSFTDGALLGALAMSTTLSALNGPMCAALVVHRMPEGLFLATTAPDATRRRTLWRVGGLMLATVLGALVGDWLLRLLPDWLFDTVAAIGFGAILRLSDAQPRAGAAQRLGARGRRRRLRRRASRSSPPCACRATSCAPRHGSEPSLLDACLGLFIETSPAFLIALLFGTAVRPWRSNAAVLLVGAIAGLLLSLHFLDVPITGMRATATIALGLIAIPGARSPSRSAERRRRSSISSQRRAPAYLFGLVLAASAEALLPPAAGMRPGIYALIGAAALIGALRPLAITLLAAVLLHKHAPVGPVMAMMVLAILGHGAASAR